MKQKVNEMKHPIASVPKDGTLIFACMAPDENGAIHAYRSYWLEEEGRLDASCYDGERGFNPTHWMAENSEEAITTAPMDGSPVYVMNGDHRTKGRDGAWSSWIHGEWATQDMKTIFTPTHWHCDVTRLGPLSPTGQRNGEYTIPYS